MAFASQQTTMPVFEVAQKCTEAFTGLDLSGNQPSLSLQKLWKSKAGGTVACLAVLDVIILVEEFIVMYQNMEEMDEAGMRMGTLRDILRVIYSTYFKDAEAMNQLFDPAHSRSCKLQLENARENAVKIRELYSRSRNRAAVVAVFGTICALGSFGVAKVTAVTSAGVAKFFATMGVAHAIVVVPNLRTLYHLRAAFKELLAYENLIAHGSQTIKKLEDGGRITEVDVKVLQGMKRSADALVNMKDVAATEL
jgi:hypothetical protein